MRRAWTGTALLAGSWLLGLGYLQPPQYLAWGVFLVAAAALLTEVPVHPPSTPALALAIALLVPALWVMPLPYKAIPILLTAGTLVHVVPIPRRWPRA